MDTEIYYFSGSGNSLLVARQLHKRLPGSKLIPVASLLHLDRIVVKGKTAGFVFPLHGLTLPIPMRKFLRKASFDSTEYLFAVATRGGTRCLAFEKMDGLLKRSGRKLDASFILTMFNNDSKFETYDVPSKEEIEKLEKEVLQKADAIAGTVLRRDEYREPDKGYIDFTNFKPVNYLLERLVLYGMASAERTGMNNYFYANEKCNGCGICAKVCPSGKVKITDRRPVWQDEVKCYMCYACINYCAGEASQIKSKIYMKSYTDKNERYPHPWATAGDIAAQKNPAP